MRLTIGKFDEELNVVDSLTLDTLVTESFNISIPLTGDTMTFIVNDYEFVKEDGRVVHFSFETYFC